MMADDLVFGIDLGTTFSAIAYVNKHGMPEIIPNREGDRTTPSVVFFESDGSPVVGKEARNISISEPRRTVRFFKREMGNPSYRFDVDGKDHFPEDLAAMVLKKLAMDAGAAMGTEVKKVVISVPAYFKDAQREATRTAGEIAGLEVLRIINEPTAAALAYGTEKVEGSRKLLVYDFGGGTFDVTVMTINNGVFEVLATGGDARLGGKDIDGRLVEYLAEQFLKAHDVDLRLEPHTHQDLWDKAEVAKKDLSFRTNVAVVLSAGEKTQRADIDRDTFDELISDLVARTEDCMNDVIAQAGLAWSDIDTILLAGGSSRIPAVRTMIERVTGHAGAFDMNPDECVAMGAAVQATLAASGDDGTQAENGQNIVVKDVATHSLGVKAMSPDRERFVNSIIIPRFTEVPCRKKRTYATYEDDQRQVVIEILQGEDEDPDSPNVELVGKTGMKNLPDHKAGDLIIEVTMSYDRDGVIEVVAKELMGGATTRELVMQKSGALSGDIVAEKKAALEEEAL